MEHICILEGTYEDGHLGYETRETRQTEVSQTSYCITYREEWNNLHQTTQVTYVTCTSLMVNHTDNGEEEGGHQTVRQHLEDCTSSGCLGHHTESEEHHTTVRY